MPTLKPGTIVEGRLQVQSLIATGGFGSVYKVRHLLMNKTLALKALHPVIKSDTTILRLKRESVAISKLDHANIVHCTDFGMIDGTVPFIVMEYVKGQTLSESLKGRPPLSVDEALNIFIPICEALAYAHDQGVIHRDIKPGNIMLSIDEKDPSRVVPKIVDFGIAKLTFGEDAGGLTLTRTGDVFGTPLYMSPEQCAGASVDHRADIYSLGCVLFETLTGTPPITGNTPLEAMMRHSSGEIPSLKEASLGKEFPKALEYIIAKMLAKDMRQRYQNCYEVANDLRLVLQGDEASVRTAAMPARALEAAGPARRIEWLVVALIGIAALATGIACGIAVQPFLIHTPSISMGRDPFSSPNLDTTPIKSEEVVATEFFRDHQQPNVFHFPKKRSMGKLSWVIPPDHQHLIQAIGDVTVPPNSKLELIPSDTLLITPSYWNGFHPTDLWGLYLRSIAPDGSDAEADFSDGQVAVAWQQRNLGMLELKDMALHERAYKLLNSMPKLTSLTLQKVEVVDDSDPTKADQLSTMQVADLHILRQLDTLRLSDIHGSVTPILRQLPNSHLRRLALWDCESNEEDINTIAKISSLEALEIMSAVPTDKQLEQFSHLPKLKKLCILGQDQPLKQNFRFPVLTDLFVIKPKEELKSLRDEYKKHLVVPSRFDWQTNFKVDGDQPSQWFGQLP